MLTIEEKATIKFIHNYDYAESYNSAFRAVVDKPIAEKYARNLIQAELKKANIVGARVNKLYLNENGTQSELDNGWIFGLTLSPLQYDSMIHISEMHN